MTADIVEAIERGADYAARFGTRGFVDRLTTLDLNDAQAVAIFARLFVGDPRVALGPDGKVGTYLAAWVAGARYQCARAARR